MTANTPDNWGEVRRLMIYEDEHGVYLFGFNRVSDGGGLFDEWYETIADAKAAAYEGYQVALNAWTHIDDPIEHCQHDWIQPVRIKGRDIGKPEWGKAERLVNGQWETFDPKE